ncbi:MAG: T9SS type A sorting domain-containing protein, partial [Bacteroidetes bacterium]|nr:T9SS type A sorting domain-containing protein [Bacteroidota bacterium]
WYELEDHGDGTATLTIFASEIDMNKADHNVSDDNPWRIEFNMGNHAYGNTNMLVKTFTVTFVVKDEDGDVITGASVELDAYDGNDNAGDIWGGSGFVYEVWASGDYEYTVSAEGFKPASDIILSVVEDLTINVVLEDETIGISEIDNNVKIYPNPSTGLFNIEFNGIKGVVNMTILNYQGQVVSSQTFNSDGAGVSQKLNLGEFAKGIYYVRIQSGDIIKVEKLILQ